MGPSGEPRWKITPKSATEYDVKVTTVADREIIDSELAKYSTLEEVRSYYEGKGYTCE